MTTVRDQGWGPGHEPGPPPGPGCGIMAGGEIVHTDKDRFGEITVLEECGRRSLLSTDGTLQSLAFVDRPSFLAMDYSQGMMTSLLFLPSPARVLLIGLGGGTMANFLLENCPQAHVDAVEISPAVIAVAHRFFGLPEGSPRLRIIEGDGTGFVAEQVRAHVRYDLVLVDAFDKNGIAAPLRQGIFFENCRRIMHKKSVLSVNLWDRPEDDFPGIHKNLDTAFRGNTLKLHLGENYCNVVVLAFSSLGATRNLHRLRPAARELGQRCGINFSRFLRNLFWQNQLPKA